MRAARLREREQLMREAQQIQTQIDALKVFDEQDRAAGRTRKGEQVMQVAPVSCADEPAGQASQRGAVQVLGSFSSRTMEAL